MQNYRERWGLKGYIGVENQMESDMEIGLLYLGISGDGMFDKKQIVVVIISSNNSNHNHNANNYKGILVTPTPKLRGYGRTQLVGGSFEGLGLPKLCRIKNGKPRGQTGAV